MEVCGFKFCNLAFRADVNTTKDARQNEAMLVGENIPQAQEHAYADADKTSLSRRLSSAMEAERHI